MIQKNKILRTYVALKSRFIEFFQKDLVCNLNTVSKDNFVRIPLLIDKLWIFDPLLTKKLLKNPINYIPIVDHAAFTVYRNLVCFGKNEKIIIKSSIEGPFEKRTCHLNNLKATFIGEIICIKGLVVKYTETKIKIEHSVHFSSKTEKFFVNQFNNPKSNNCWYYLFKDENMNSLETEYGLCKFVNWQNILLQDYSRQYHKKKTCDSICAILENDLVNTCRLGGMVELCGIYSPFVLSKFHFESDFFSPALFVLSVKNLTKINRKNLNQFDYFLMKNFSIIVNSFQRLSTLIAPRIIGQTFVKKGILLFLTGESLYLTRFLTSQSTNLNFLVIGESQKTKSELLFFISKLTPSFVFLEGGKSHLNIESKRKKFDPSNEKIDRLFFVDKKILFVNHIEKINQNEKKIIKEIIDQQTISVERNGLLLSLKARCGVLGFTNSFMKFGKNSLESRNKTEIPKEILSRFDLKFFLLENISEEYDKKMASLILKQHQDVKSGFNYQIQNKKSKESENLKNFFNFSRKKQIKTKKKKNNNLPFIFFKIYINFSKKNIQPVFSTGAGDFLLRNYKKIKETKSSSILISIKHFEILIKLSHAVARCHLRSVVSEKDINFCCIFLLKSLKSEERVKKKKEEIFSYLKSERKIKRPKKRVDLISIQNSETNGQKEKSWKVVFKKKKRININFKKITSIGLKFQYLKHFLNLEKICSSLENLFSIMLEKKFCLIYKRKIIKI